MNETPKSLRLQIGIFGRTNVGKSSFLNMLSGQETAITSPIPGTTTDVVEKTMELLPIGPVVLLDTAGIDDRSVLSPERTGKTLKAFSRADIAVILTEPGVFGTFEEKIMEEAKKHKIPFMLVVNKTDVTTPEAVFVEALKKHTPHVLLCSATAEARRGRQIEEFKTALLKIIPDPNSLAPSLIGDLLPSGGVAILIVPIDLEAPKGRLILPQVQTIRDALDNDASIVVVKEREYPFMLENLKKAPDVVICDSQVVQKMVADTPPSIKCTTFSILFARLKGELNELVSALPAIERLKEGDKVLIAEACSHHALEDDIGRIKIPRWLRQYTGLPLDIDVTSGRDYPENLKDYSLIIHCGACMLTKKEMGIRTEKAKRAGIPITNYGLCISYLQGVLKRVLSPFPQALHVFEEASKTRLQKGAPHA